MRKILFFIFLFLGLGVCDDISSNLDKLNIECKNCQNLKSENIKKVYASNPSLLYGLYSFDKSKISALLFEFWDIEKRYLDKNVYELPVVGGFFGGAKMPNIELLAKLNPDLILTLSNSKDTNFIKTLEKLNLNIAYINQTDNDELFGADLRLYEGLGEIFANKKRADELIAYARQSIKMSQNLEQILAQNGNKKPNVYYAYGKDGLKSECGSNSFMRLIEAAGGNTQKFACKSKFNSRVKVDFENLLAKNPDVILVYHKEFFDKIYSDKKWASINAVKNKRVYLIPRSPFSWAGKPGSFMQILGLRWLIYVLHNNALNIDLKEQTQEFYELFLYKKLSQEDLNFILNENN